MKPTIRLALAALFCLASVFLSNAEEGEMPAPMSHTALTERNDSAKGPVAKVKALADSISVLLNPKTNKTPFDPDNHNWWYLLKNKRLKINDPDVQWPKGIGKIIRIYNKVDKALNNYDTTYVASFSRSGKVMLLSDNWFDQYLIGLDADTEIRLSADPYYTAGFGVSYMGIGYSYKLDLSNLIGKVPSKHSQHKLSLGCARFQLEYSSISSKGGINVVEFNRLPEEIVPHHFFSGAEFSLWNISGHYFFNSSRYSHGAAYSFSKRQKKSAGTFLVGLSHAVADFYFDFEKFPIELKPFLDLETLKYRFHYRNTSIIAGYGFNWVFNRHLMLNLTAYPGIGFNHCYEDSQEKSLRMIAFSGHAGMAMTYNLERFYCGFNTIYEMLTYQSNRYSLLSSVITFSVNAGIRF